MGNSLIPYSIATDDEYIYLLTPHFKFIKKEMNNNDEILNTNEKKLILMICMFHDVEKTRSKNEDLKISCNLKLIK